MLAKVDLFAIGVFEGGKISEIPEPLYNQELLSLNKKTPI